MIGIRDRCGYSDMLTCELVASNILALKFDSNISASNSILSLGHEGGTKEDDRRHAWHFGRSS
jgi:hypothetical protein